MTPSRQPHAPLSEPAGGGICLHDFVEGTISLAPHYTGGTYSFSLCVWSSCPNQSGQPLSTSEYQRNTFKMDTAQMFVTCALHLELRSEDLDMYFSTNFFLTVLKSGSITCSTPRYLYGSSLLAAGTVRSSESAKTPPS